MIQTDWQYYIYPGRKGLKICILWWSYNTWFCLLLHDFKAANYAENLFSKLLPTVLISDGSSEHGAHV